MQFWELEIKRFRTVHLRAPFDTVQAIADKFGALSMAKAVTFLGRREWLYDIADCSSLRN